MKLLETGCYIVCVLLLLVICLALFELGYMSFILGIAGYILYSQIISIKNMKEQ